MSEQTVQAESTRDRIVQTAIGLFHTRSYTAVGVAEICAESRVNKGSFYHYFDSKDAVVLAAIDTLRDGLDAALRQILIDDADTPPLERIERFFEMLHRKNCGRRESLGYFPGCPIGNLVAEMSTQNEAVRERLAAMYDHWAKMFEAPLREARDRGDLPPDIDIKAMAPAIVAMTQGLSLIGKAYNDPKKILKVGRTLVRRVLGIET